MTAARNGAEIAAENETGMAIGSRRLLRFRGRSSLACMRLCPCPEVTPAKCTLLSVV